MAFDLLAVGGEDLRERRLRERRARLEELVPDSDRLRLTPSTVNAQESRAWFYDFRDAGCEGIVAKRDASSYRPGKVTWVKVRATETADVVLCGFRVGPRGRLQSLLVGAYRPSGDFRYVGETLLSGEEDLPELHGLLEGLRTERRVFASGYPSPAVQSRREGYRGSRWAAIEPKMVVEVAYDRLDYPGVFRHPARLVRIRPDKEPTECTVPFSTAALASGSVLDARRTGVLVHRRQSISS